MSRRPAWKKQEDEFCVRPLEVVVENGDIEFAIKLLKNKVSRDGILAELKKRRFAEKPSEEKRRKHREALKKMRKSRGRKARVRASQSKR